MLHFTIIMADTIMIAHLGPNGRWRILCQDNFTGDNQEASWTNEQFTSVLALMNGVGEDETPGFDAKKLYEVCEPLFKDWPKNVRPIP